MAVRGVRGATTIENNDSFEMIEASRVLLEEIIKRNEIKQEDMVSIFFTVTQDLDAAFPAVAARQLGITDVALMCMNEINVPGSLPKCIRILLHINTEKSNGEISHVYLNGAKILRPDLDKSTS